MLILLGGRKGTFVPPVLAHRYWRVEILDAYGVNNAGTYFCNIAKVAMFDATGGVDLCTGGTPLGSTASGSFPIANVFDQNLATVVSLLPGGASPWAAGTVYIGYDFGSGNAKEIIGVQLVADSSTGTQLPSGRVTHNSAPQNYNVQYSDNGSTWTTKWSVTDSVPNLPGLHEARTTFDAGFSYSGSFWGAHTYWRVYCLIHASGGAYHMAELEYRATAAGADQAAGGTAAASSQFGPSFTAAMAHDNNNSTVWASANTTYPQYIQYQFAAPVTVAQLMIRAAAANFNECPTAILASYSDDGTNFHPAWYVRNTTAWMTAEQRLWNDPYFI